MLTSIATPNLKTDDLSLGLASAKNLQYLVFPLLVCLLVGISLPKFVIPQVNRLTAARNEIKTLQQKQASLTAKLTKLQNLSETDLASDATLLGLALPPQKAVEEAMLGLSDLAEKHHLAVMALEFNPGLISSPSAQTSSPPPDSLKITINVQGNTPDLENFLTQLSRHIPIVGIEEFNLSYPDSLTLKVTSLWSPLPTTLPPVDTPLPLLESYEQDILNLVKSFSPSQAVTETAPQFVPSEKTDPFVP